MDYQWHYDQLILTRKNRIPEKGVYYEMHHIIPRSMGGNDTDENLLLLTAREHFIAHWLLWRIYRNRQTAFAFFCMQNWKNKKAQGSQRCKSARSYQEAREAYSKFLSEFQSGKKKKFAKRRPHSDETKQKMSDKKKGVKLGPISPSRSEKLSVYKKNEWKRYRDEIGFVDNIQKECEHCKKEFIVNLWGRNTRFCSKSCSGKASDKKPKPIQVIDKRTNEKQEYKTISEASRELNIKRSEIYKNNHEHYIFITCA